MGWDVIVVGAGSAGAALAARSAAAAKRVLLLEAGPDYRSAEMPEVWRSPNPARALSNPGATAQLVWAGLDATRTDTQRPAPYWRGRGVGGSSSVNGQIAIRPPMEEFDDWVGAGCVGWSARDVLPYFTKLERDEDFADEPYHGSTGPIPIFRMPQQRWGMVDAALLAGALSAGHMWAPDVNSPAAIGVSPYPINCQAGRRVSVNDGYLEPARDLATLTIRGHSLVERVVFAGNRAVGVSVVRDGALRTEYADEVVLCAGVIHSPAILLRSGIGPARDLRLLGITARQDLPVGQGMQDHPLAMITLPLRDSATVRTPDDRHTNVCVRYTSGSGGRPYDMMVVSLNHNALAMAAATTRVTAGGVGVWVNHAYSRGRLTITSTDPMAQPEVRERMLSDPRDRLRLREGVRQLVELALGPEIKDITAGSLAEHNKPLFAALDDDAALEDYLLGTVLDAQHGTSTCRMGAPDAATTVVDPSCRVLGMAGLRVVDASICPSVPRANTNLISIMLGERMAERLD